MKALEGDPSDNLPGVPGVGTKTAAKLILKYGSAEEVVAHASEQTPKLAQSLAAHAGQVAINKQLSTLIEVPLNEVGLEDLKMGMWDLNEIRELFTSFEFKSLLERLVSELPMPSRARGNPSSCARAPAILRIACRNWLKSCAPPTALPWTLILLLPEPPRTASRFPGEPRKPLSSR